MAIESPKPVDNMNNNTTKYLENINYCKKGFSLNQRIPSKNSKYRAPKFKKNEAPQNNNNNNNEKKTTFPPNKNNQEKPQRTSPFDGKDVPLMKYDQKINTSYTPFTLFVHLTIIFQHLYTLYLTPSTTISPKRITSFTQLVYVTTTCFHIATLLANLFKKCQVEKVFVLYGTWVIWSGWAMCLWLINPEVRPDPLLPRTLTTGSTRGFYYINGNGTIVLYDFEAFIQPMDVSPFLMHGKWTSTTLPILSFFLLLAIRRNHWGLLTWEHLVVLESTNSLKYYRTWCIAGAGAGWILLWEAIKFWCHVPFAYTSSTDENIIFYRTDITRFPGLFNILLICFVSGLFMICWWSFWTFQYKGVVWKKELKEGVVVWSSNGLIQVGGVC
ncbi:hypothetical protein Glove_121g68 [Diversispora epigaea]|uniref:Uncharacterized protein n=1 Tax=Diversispora epigaea TaxID=1348612 RepID=A0A397J8K3_9GLOM|nr:hypothetical protein Glove_121g68 [Diversispora epigaea]